MANYDTMRAYLDKIIAGEFEAVEDYYTDDIVVHFAGQSAAAGEYHGKVEYTAALSKIMGLIDDLAVEEHDLLVSDDHAVVLNTWHVTRGDASADLKHVIVYHTRGDQISEIWIVPEDQQANAAILS